MTLRRRENKAAPNRPRPTSAVVIGSGTLFLTMRLLPPCTGEFPLSRLNVMTSCRENKPVFVKFCMAASQSLLVVEARRQEVVADALVDGFAELASLA